MVQVIHIWQDFTHHLEGKVSRKRGHTPSFFSFFFCCVLLCEIRFARQGSVNACGAAVSVILCTGVASQGCWPGCQPSCWLSNHRSSFPRLGTQRKESGKCRHRAEHLRHVYFLQWKLPVNHSISFNSPLIYSLNISWAPTTPDIWKGKNSSK